MYGCSNIADLNTRYWKTVQRDSGGVSLYSFPVLKESAQYFVGDFAICSIQVLCFGRSI